jgi:hypothetical protein
VEEDIQALSIMLSGDTSELIKATEIDKYVNKFVLTFDLNNDTVKLGRAHVFA